MKAKRPIPLLAAQAYFYDGSALESEPKSGRNLVLRSLPMWGKIGSLPEVRDVLEKALITGSVQRDIATDEGLKACYRKGWLQAERVDDKVTTYIYPTRVHLM